MRRVLPVMLLALALAVVSVTHAAAFGVRDLGAGRGQDINNNGQILLGTGVEGRILNANGTVARTISFSNAYATVTVTRMNDTGTVIGYQTLSVSGTLRYSRYVWNSDGTTASNGANGCYYNVSGLNNSGTVVGQTWPAPSYENPTPYGWVTGIDINHETDQGSCCSGINNSGVVAGYTADYVNGRLAGNAQAHLYLPSGAVVDLGPGFANAINDSGVVAGRTQDNRVCYWSADHVMHDIGLLNGYTGAFVQEINSSGAIVGYCYNYAVGSYRGFYWSDATGLVQLPGLNTEDNTEAFGINDAGQIVGVSGSRAVMWCIPEPATICGLLCGLAGFATLRRRRR